MNLSNESMVVSGLDKNNNNLNALKSNSSITNLEIKQLTLKDNWTLLSELKQLRSLTVKDSYVDFKKFYSAICNLPKLEQLTYNHYCFFNKDKKDKLPGNLKLPSLKIFKLEFPDESEPDFDINTYGQENYKIKHNSITELKNSYKIFPNLEEIQFVNYQTYKKRMEDYKSNKKLNSSLYWNMDFKTLNQFKYLKNIKFNDGQPKSLLVSGSLEIFLDKISQDSKFKFNGISNDTSQDLIKGGTIIFNHKDQEQINLKTVKIKSEIYHVFKDNLDADKAMEINPKGLYKFHKSKDSWKLKEDKLAILLQNTKFESIIFSPIFNFMDNNFESWQLKKAGYNLDFLKAQTNIKSVILDLSKGEDDKWNNEKFPHLVKFIYDLLLQNQNIKIYLYHDELKQFFSQEKVNDHSFKIHLVYLLSFYFNHKKEFNERIQFVGAQEHELEEFYNHYLKEELENIYVINDILFEKSKRTSDIDLFYEHEIKNFEEHYPFCGVENLSTRNDIPLNKNYYELFRILSLNDSEVFLPDDHKLTLIIKKNNLSQLNRINPTKIKKYYFYTGTHWHHINHFMNENAKKWKIENYDNSEKHLKLLSESRNKTVDHFVESRELTGSENYKSDFLKPLEQFTYLTSSGVDSKILKNLTACWLEGVVPWGSEYLRLDQLNKYIPTENLEYLRIRDCLAMKNLDFPYMPKLKFLHLSPGLNHHKKKQDPESKDELRHFENLPHLEELVLDRFYSTYKDDLSKTCGFHTEHRNRWGNILIDFSNLHQLKKLKKINFKFIPAARINKITALPVAEEIIIHGLFHITKEMNPDKESEIQRPINDSDLRFLRKTPKLQKLYLEFGEGISPDWYDNRFESSAYSGKADFIDYISHNIKELTLNINFDEKSQGYQSDIINKICNRFLKLEKLILSFSVAATQLSFDFEHHKFKRKLQEIKIDIKKFTKMKNLKSMVFQWLGTDGFVPCKVLNFRDIVKFKKLKNFSCPFKQISFEEFRAVKLLFQNEKCENPTYYDEDYAYLEEEDKKNWSRFVHINTAEQWDDWYSLASEYENKEKEENKKKYKKPKQIIQKKKN